ncbi:hypothetical protein M9H77_25496 [Catharanthus roseus]|uniref:Uncharacterized protein n=1 Tax=Catharanthus roseus TaxID=4058 RepID=A0ACC0A9M4_CATRO|nr:hypothetical protein M9H77_25496 [Catharanthus roseus]
MKNNNTLTYRRKPDLSYCFGFVLASNWYQSKFFLVGSWLQEVEEEIEAMANHKNGSGNRSDRNQGVRNEEIQQSDGETGSSSDNSSAQAGGFAQLRERPQSISKKVGFDRSNNASISKMDNGSRGGQIVAPLRSNQPTSDNSGKVVQIHPNKEKTTVKSTYVLSLGTSIEDQEEHLAVGDDVMEEGINGAAVYTSPSTGILATNSSASDRDASPFCVLKTVQN